MARTTSGHEVLESSPRATRLKVSWRSRLKYLRTTLVGCIQLLRETG